MSKILAIFGVVAVAVIAAVAGWWFFVREDAEPKTNSQTITDDLRTAVATSEASTPTAAGKTGTSSGGGVIFAIIPEQSEATYLAGETLASVGLPSTAEGATQEIAGTLYLTSDGWALDSANETKVTVQLANLTTDQDRRDNRVREALEVTTYPEATFVATSVSEVDQSIPLDQERTFQMRGIMTLHGVEKEVTWEVKARREGDIMTALATITFLYTDFNITAPDIGGFVSVDDDVTLQMDIVASLVN